MKLFTTILVVGLVAGFSTVLFCIFEQDDEPEPYCDNYGHHFDKLTDCCFYQKIADANKISWEQWNMSFYDTNLSYSLTEFEYSGKAVCLNSIFGGYQGCKMQCVVET